MKRTLYLVLFVALLLFVVMGSMANAVETTLNSQFTNHKPGVSVIQYSFQIIENECEVSVKMHIQDEDGKVVSIFPCDFTDCSLTGAVIQQSKVGDKYTDVIARAIHSKCKQLFPEFEGSDD